MIKAAIITMSDKGYKGEREDLSAEEIKKLIKKIPANLTKYVHLPDEKEMIIDRVGGMTSMMRSGGTGVGVRDFTPEATLAVIDKEVPGMAEAMRLESLKKTPYAMISRAVVGIRVATLIINLPGSPKGVRENFAVVVPAIKHAVEKIKGDMTECGQA